MSGRSANAPAARMFTHISEDDFRIVRDNLAGGKRSTRDRLIPYCMFTDPPLAHVGLSEREAERQGVKTRIARLPMKAVLRAQATGETEGFMKALVGENDDRILGFTMIGAAGRRGDGRGANGDDGGLALHETARRRLRTSDHGRGIEFLVFEHAGPDERMKR